MAFEKGNQWWKLRTKHGRDKLFNDPQLLWEEAVKYFEATDERKWIKKDWVGKDAVQVERETETPYTKSGLCLFLDISEWRLLENLKNDSDDFFQIITRIEKVIYTQKLEGAAVGAFNSSIIARDLGLQEKSEVDLTTKGESINQSISVEIIKPKEDED